MKEERNRTRFSRGRVGLTCQLLVDFVVKPKKKENNNKVATQEIVTVMWNPSAWARTWDPARDQTARRAMESLTFCPRLNWFLFFFFVNVKLRSEAEEGSHERVCSVWTGSQLWSGSHSQALSEARSVSAWVFITAALDTFSHTFLFLFHRCSQLHWTTFPLLYGRESELIARKTAAQCLVLYVIRNSCWLATASQFFSFS